MAQLLNIPENVIIQHLFPLLDHNDLLRLRRVSKQTKAYADTYLWTPKPGHQGKWSLQLKSTQEIVTLQAFLQSGQPPPASRLSFIFDSENEALPCPRRYFFESDPLKEFMLTYSKYITHLEIYEMRIPFTSLEEIQFYESLVNLENLDCGQMKTVGGAAQFEEKTRNANGSFLIRPTFKKLKRFTLSGTDCLDAMWNFLNGVSDNLEEILHPLHPGDAQESGDDDDDDDNEDFQLDTNLVPVRELIERRRLRNQNTLLYDWTFIEAGNVESSELVRLLACCRDNGVLIKNLDSEILDFLFVDENGRMIGENYEGNLFVRNIIHSLINMHDNAYQMNMPALEKIEIWDTAWSAIRICEGRDSPEWPNLMKMKIRVNSFAVDLLHFLCGCPNLKRPKLEKLLIDYCSTDGRFSQLPLPCPRSLGITCGNLKKLALHNCPGDDYFFLALWEALPLLEKVELIHCSKLTIKGFVGNGGRGSTPVFLKLERLKHLSLEELDGMPRIGDAVFKKVICHLKLVGLKLASAERIRSITVAGIKQLLTGQFAETIQKLDLDWLHLVGVVKKDLDQVVSCFRCSKLL